MHNIFFSIVIPTYNRAKFIDKAIASLLNQKYEDFEVIVVDDGSTDNTEEVVKSFNNNKVKYYKKENQERGAARNYGAKLAKGEYINFFDSGPIGDANSVTFESLTVADKFIMSSCNEVLPYIVILAEDGPATTRHLIISLSTVPPSTHIVYSADIKSPT